MKPKILAAFTAVLLALTPNFASAQTGKVKGDNVNVRGQATLQSEVVTQLKKGETVTIIDKIPPSRRGPKEPSNWYRIALPDDTPVWVSARFVKDNAVTATRLNVRSGPGQNFSVLGRITKGTQVNELRRVNDWIEIGTPAGVHGYVAGFLIEAEGFGTDTVAASPVVPVEPVTPAEPVTPVEPPTTAVIDVPEVTPIVPTTLEDPELSAVVVAPIEPAPIQPIQTTPAPTPDFQQPPAGAQPTVSTIGDAPPTPAVAPNPALMPDETDLAAETGDVRYRVAPEPKKKTMLGRWWQRLTTRKSKDAETAPPPSSGNVNQPSPVLDEGPLEPRIISREGIVVRVYNIQAPSDWGLREVHTSKLINYLWAADDEIPWTKLRGRTVLVTGEEAMDRRWKRVPVLKIETLKTVDDDGEG
ncbi:MAG: hypothetical protein CMO80_04810 [Verrucomicrobiales bacterium]|nr:hypothetical protein [Verrucomicrobiales bacterium]